MSRKELFQKTSDAIQQFNLTLESIFKILFPKNSITYWVNSIQLINKELEQIQHIVSEHSNWKNKYLCSIIKTLIENNHKLLIKQGPIHQIANEIISDLSLNLSSSKIHLTLSDSLKSSCLTFKNLLESLSFMFDCDKSIPLSTIENFQ
jgi:hypothetical protein